MGNNQQTHTMLTLKLMEILKKDYESIYQGGTTFYFINNELLKFLTIEDVASILTEDNYDMYKDLLDLLMPKINKAVFEEYYFSKPDYKVFIEFQSMEDLDTFINQVDSLGITWSSGNSATEYANIIPYTNSTIDNYFLVIKNNCLCYAKKNSYNKYSTETDIIKPFVYFDFKEEA